MKFSDVKIVEVGTYSEPGFQAVSLCIACKESLVEILLTETELAEMLEEIRRTKPNPPVTP